MSKWKSSKDYAIEAAEKRLKMRDCRHCGSRVWGGYVDVSWVFMDPVNLSPPEEARLMFSGVPTWEVRWVAGEWYVELRIQMSLNIEARTGVRHIVFPNHQCRINQQQEGWRTR